MLFRSVFTFNFVAGELVPIPTFCEVSIVIAVVPPEPVSFVLKTSEPVVSPLCISVVVDVVPDDMVLIVVPLRVEVCCLQQAMLGRLGSLCLRGRAVCKNHQLCESHKQIFYC